MMSGNGGWIWMTMLLVAWTVAVLVVVWIAIVSTTTPRSRDVPRESPRDVLDRRFANGEIDAATHASMRAQLDHRTA